MSFQMPQAVNVPMKEKWAWEMKSLIFQGPKQQQKRMGKKIASWRQYLKEEDLQALHLPKSRKEAD